MSELTATQKRNQKMIDGVNQNQQRPQQSSDVQDVELVFKNPTEFRGQHGTEITTTLELCGRINKLFKDTIPDWEGCIIYPDQNGKLQCSLYFHLSPQKDKYSIVQSAESMTTNTNDAAAKYRRMSMRSQNRKLFLTEFGKKLLFDFIYKDQRVKDASKINWNQYTTEQVDIQPNGHGIPLLKVSYIDLNKIIKKSYLNDQNRHYQWNISTLQPIGMTGAGTPNFMVSITRLDVAKVEELATQLGFIASAGSIPIVR